MQKYANNVTDRFGNAAAGVAVHIVVHGAGTPATIYSDNGVTPKANPITTDHNGYIEFYAADGRYDITVGSGGYSDVIVADPIAMSNSLAGGLPGSSGAALVGYDGGTVQDVADEAKPMANYAALRAYTGRASGVRITDLTTGGIFERDPSDTTTADNGGTVIVDGAGRRWKRNFSGAVSVMWFGALQQAQDAAGANGSILIPGEYAGTDGISNPNNIPIIDLRHKQLGIHSAIGPQYPVTGYPFGHDLRLSARGPADIYIEHFHVVATTTQDLIVGWNYNVPISATSFKGRGVETMTGGSEKFSTIAQIVLSRETANEEQVNAGNWAVVDANHLDILCTKTHTGTTDIDQGGSTLLASHDLYVASHMVKPSQNTTYDAPLRLKDLGGRYIAKIPSNIANSFPYQAWQWGCIQTGFVGGNSDLIFQNFLPTSSIVYRNNAGSSIATLNDTGNFAVVAGIATGINNMPINGALGELRAGKVSAAITSTTDAFVAWQNNTDPLNSTATGGSLLLASRNVASTSINFATQNTLRAAITSAGMRVVAGFGCNGKTPQGAVAVNAACTDLPTAIALINQLRAALIANGICV